MSNWSCSQNESGGYDYHWSRDEADAVVYQHDGRWHLGSSMATHDEWKQRELGVMSADEAVQKADDILMDDFKNFHRDVVAEQTVALREEVREDYAAWQADLGDYELEREYFDKMDRLDINLAERGLERGEDIDEEIPLIERIRGVLNNRNEDGMIRLPWRDKGPYVVQASREGESRYLSRHGMEEPPLGPIYDTLDNAATFEVKNDARHFAAIADSQGLAEGGQLEVIPEREAQQNLDRSLEQSLDQSLDQDRRHRR